MGSRGGGGGLQDLLEHAAREYEKVDTAARGPEELGSPETIAAAAVLKRSNQPAGNAESSGSADPEGQGTDRVPSSGGDGSNPSWTGTPSRKRQRVGAGPTAVSPSPEGGGGQGPKSHFSEDGGSGWESNGRDAEAAAGKDGAEGRRRQGSNASVELCQYEGCNKAARSGGRKFCRRHGEGRRCKVIGCNKVDVGGGSCRKHGGGRRCGAEGCMKTDVGGGFCVSHGGGKRCQAEGCAKGAQAGGVFCKSHGGGRRCRIEGCMTSAQSGADVLCIKHGGGKRCMVAGCKKLVRKNNRCTKHASEAVNTVARPPAAAPTPPLPAKVAINAAKAKAAVAATAAVLTATTRAAAPLAPAPTPHRRPAPPPHPRIAEPLGPPSPPEQAEAQTRVDGGVLLEHIEVQAQGEGGLLPPVPSMAREPTPSYPPVPVTGGDSRGSLSSLRPPLAAFDDRVLSAGGPMHSVSASRWVPDGGGHSNGNGNGLPSRSNHNDAGLRAPLPGVGSIGSSMPGVDQRGGTREGAMRVGQHAPNSSPPAPLFLSGAGLPRHLPAGVSAAAREGGRADIANNNYMLARSLHEMVGPSSARGLPVADRPLPPYPSGRYSEGAMERSPSLSPLPPSLLLQQPPPPLPPSYPPAASASARDVTGGKRVFAWSGDKDLGNRPVAHRDDRGGVGPNRSGSYLYAAGELTSTAELARPPAGATAPTSAGAMFAGNLGQANGSGGSISPSLLPGGVDAPDVLSEPFAAASQSIGAGHPMPAAERPSRPSGCCGGKNGDNKASQGSVTGAGDTRQSQGRSCSTSPPLEQTSSFISLNVAGMMCMENCGQTVQRALREVPGVQSVTVHFPTRTASVKVDTASSVSSADLTAAVEAIGFTASCIASTTTEEPSLGEDGVNAVWAIASALGLVDRGCAMAWGDPCSCGDECQCINCPYHGKNIKEASHAVDLVLKAASLSNSTDPPPPKQPQQQDQRV
eukprot:g8008.t1